VILEGQAEVLHDGKHLADLGPGDYFGEMALLEGTRRNASVVAKSPIRLGVMLSRDFAGMEEEMPAVTEMISSAVRKRAAELNAS